MYNWHLELEDNLLAYVSSCFVWYVKKIHSAYVEDTYEIRLENRLGELIRIEEHKLKDIPYGNNAIPDRTALKELLCFLK